MTGQSNVAVRAVSQPQRRRLSPGVVVALRVLLVVGSVFVACVFGEVAIRLLVPIHPHGWFTRVADDDLYYVPTASIHFQWDGEAMTHNSLGMRELREYEPASKAHARVAFVGDSVCYGCRVNDDQTLAVQTEQLLQKRLAVQTPECLNFGVPGYNTHQILATVHKRVGDFAGVRAVVYVFSENDLVNATFEGASLHMPRKLYVNYEKPTSTTRYYLKQSRLAHFLFARLGDLSQPASAQPQEQAPRQRPEAHSASTGLYRTLMLRDSPHRQRFAELLGELNRVCAERNWSLALLYVPSEESLCLDPNRAYQAQLRAICKEQGLKFLDGADFLACNSGEALYADNGHPNAAGHQRLAAGVADWLARHVPGGRGE